MKLLLSLAFPLVAFNLVSAQIPCDYNFCPDGVTFPYGDVDEDNGLLCSDIPAAITNNELSAMQCATLAVAAPSLCCPVVNPSQTCFLCGSKVNYKKDKTFPGEPVTCGTMDALYSNVPATENCDELRTNGMMNMASYCECEGAVAPDLDVCKVCADNQVVNKNVLVPDEEANGLVPDEEANGMTCGEGFGMLKHMTNETECADVLTDAVKAACCMDKPSSGNGPLISSFATILLVGLAFVI